MSEETKTFAVGLYFEEGLRLKIQASSEAEAKSKAEELVSEHASVTFTFPAEFKPDAIHRDYWATDAEETEITIGKPLEGSEGGDV
jgi:hypothetical protein